jgi:quercetin dioxygenase-like cupin family protein
MKKKCLNNFTGGWFLGDFEPTLLSNAAFEVSVKYYRKGDNEPSHYHKLATEWTVITAGEVEMNGLRYSPGDIIEVAPGEITQFTAITDATTTVVKVPSIKGDKYIFDQSTCDQKP